MPSSSVAALALVTAGLVVLAGAVPAVQRSQTAQFHHFYPQQPQQDTSVSAEERACLDDLKLLLEGRCYQLLSTGPCRAHEWLVLDAALPLRPVCQRVPCAEREVLWPRDNRCYQRFRDRQTLCPHAGTLLVSNPFGLGECACMRTPPHARLAGAGPACHALYRQGPCPQGQILVPKVNATWDQGVCVRDPCTRAAAAALSTTTTTTGTPTAAATTPHVLWADGDGRCHRLGASDVCPEDSSFGIHPQTLRPGCISRINHLLPPTPCSGDKCSPTNTAAYSEGYIKELLQAHRNHKSRSSG